MSTNRIYNIQEWQQIGIAATPSSGTSIIYPKLDGNWYYMNSDGIEKIQSLSYKIGDGLTSSLASAPYNYNISVNIDNYGLTFTNGKISIGYITASSLSQLGNATASYILSVNSSGLPLWVPYTTQGINGVLNYVSRFSGTSSLTSSNIFDGVTYISVFTSSNSAVTPQLFVNGTIDTSKLYLNSSAATYLSSNSTLITINSQGLSVTDGTRNYLQSLRNDTNGNTFNLLNSLFQLKSLGSGNFTASLTLPTINVVGIGTATPSNLLHIYSTQSAFRLQDGSQGYGKYLISDSNGLSTWATISGVGIAISGITFSILLQSNSGLTLSNSGLGIQFVNNSGLTLSSSGIGINSTIAGFGLSYSAGQLSVTPAALSLDFSGGLVSSGGTVSINTGTGLTISSNKLILDPTIIGNGLTYSGGSISTINFLTVNMALNYIPLSNGVSSLTSSNIYQSSNNILIGTTSNIGSKLYVVGTFSFVNDGIINNINIGRGNSSTNLLLGNNALSGFTPGNYNIAIGDNTLQLNSGKDNIAIGVSSSVAITSATATVAIGNYAMSANNINSNAIAIGYNSGYKSGANSISIGAYAGSSVFGNAANSISIGFGSGNLSTGSSNIFLGYLSGKSFTGSYSVFIGGYDSSLSTSNNIFISDGQGNLRLYVPSTGNLLVGTMSDNGYKLQVVGSASIYGSLKIADGTQALNKLLISDTNGLASWATASTILGSNFFIQGGNLFGATATLGTNDNNNLQVIAGGNKIIQFGTNSINLQAPINNNIYSLLFAPSSSIYLTATSPYYISATFSGGYFFVYLPDTSTLQLGQSFYIFNTNITTIYTFTNTQLLFINGGNPSAIFTCVDTGTNSTSAWQVNYNPSNNGDVSVATNTNKITSNNFYPLYGTTSSMSFYSGNANSVKNIFKFNFNVNSGLLNPTSNTYYFIQTNGSFGPTSGSASYNELTLSSSFGSTTSALGTSAPVRGLYVTPSFYSVSNSYAWDYRAVETTQGKIVFNDTISAGTGSSIGSLLTLNQTWNTTGTASIFIVNAIDNNSSTYSKLIDLQKNSISQFNVDKNGNIYNFGYHTIGTTSNYNYGLQINGYTNSFAILSATDSNISQIIGSTSYQYTIANIGKLSWVNNLYGTQEWASISVSTDGYSQNIGATNTSPYSSNAGNIIFNIGTSASIISEVMRITPNSVVINYNKTLSIGNNYSGTNIYGQSATNPVLYINNGSTTRTGIMISENNNNYYVVSLNSNIGITAYNNTRNGITIDNVITPTMSSIYGFNGSVQPSRDGGAPVGMWIRGGRQFQYFTTIYNYSSNTQITPGTVNNNETFGYVNYIDRSQSSDGGTYSYNGFISTGFVQTNGLTASTLTNLINVVDFRASSIRLSSGNNNFQSNINRYGLLIDYSSSTFTYSSLPGTYSGTYSYLNAWGVYQSDANTNNYFNGTVLFGTTSNPQNALVSIYGTTSGLLQLKDTTQGTGKVLTSDANGLATWQTLSASGVAYKYAATQSFSASVPYVINHNLNTQFYIIQLFDYPTGDEIMGSYTNRGLTQATIILSSNVSNAGIIIMG